MFSKLSIAIHIILPACKSIHCFIGSAVVCSSREGFFYSFSHQQRCSLEDYVSVQLSLSFVGFLLRIMGKVSENNS